MNKIVIFWIVMASVVFLLAILPFIFPSTSLEIDKRLKTRLYNFTKLLTPQELELFKAGQYQQASSLFSQRLKEDEKLAKKFEELKYKEGMTTFTPEEVFVFFGKYMIKEIKRYDPNFVFK